MSKREQGIDVLGRPYAITGTAGARRKAQRIASQQREIEDLLIENERLKAVAELVDAYFKEVDELFLCDDAHQIIESLQAAGYGEVER